jgi:hypothetical protein
VRQIALGVGDLVDIEEDGAWDVLFEILGPRVLAVAGRVPGGIDDDDVGRIELGRELVGLGQP